MDLDPEKSLAFQQGGGGGAVEDTGPPLKDDPEYAKYFKMMKMGLPADAARQACVRDGKDPGIVDLDPDKSLASQRGGGAKPKKAAAKPKKKKPIKRKKIYWDTIDESKIDEESIWGMVTKDGEITMDKLEFDMQEFEELFTDQSKPGDKKKKAAAGGAKKKDKKKEVVSVVDAKRAMNGGIVLARIKLEFKEVENRVNKM